MSWREQRIASLALVPNYDYSSQISNGGVLTKPAEGNWRDGFAGGYQPAANLPRDPQNLFKAHQGPLEFSVWDLRETAILYAPDFVKSPYHAVGRLGLAQRAYDMRPGPGELFSGNTFAQPVALDFFPDAGLPRLRAVVQPNQQWHL